MSKPLSTLIHLTMPLFLLFANPWSIASASPQRQRISAQASAPNSAAYSAYPVLPNPILSDKKVRQAIAYCTDRRALAQSVYPTFTSLQIDALMTDSFLPKTHWAYAQPTAQYPFNPTQGQTLLDQAGWTLANGATYRANAQGEELSLKFTTTNAQFRQTWAAVFEAQMQACGIRVLRFHTPASWWFGSTTGLVRRDFELGAFAWVSEDNPQVVSLYGCNSVPSAQNNWQGQNFMGWCNQTASQAAEQASNTQLSQVARKPFFATLQEEFAKDVASLPLFLRDDGITWEHVDFNFASPPPPNPALKDVKVRQAIAYCTDRRALAQAAYPTFTAPQIDALMMDSFLPKTHWAYALPTAQYPFNPTQGQTLLDQAGWTLPNGATYRANAQGEELSLKFTTTDAQFRQTWAAVFEAQMQACGIRVLRFHTPASWWFGSTTGLVRRDFELGAFAWVSEDNPQVVGLYGCNSIPSAQNNWQGQNYMGWCNQTASLAAIQAANIMLSQAQRLPYFDTLQEAFAQDMPSLPLFLRDDGITWEHIDFNMFTPMWYVYLPVIRR